MSPSPLPRLDNHVEYPSGLPKKRLVVCQIRNQVRRQHCSVRAEYHVDAVPSQADGGRWERPYFAWPGVAVERAASSALMECRDVSAVTCDTEPD